MSSKLGILAGGGELPGRVIDACRQNGRDFHVIAIKNQADPEVIGNSPHTWVRLGAAQTALDVANREDLNEIVMVGPIKRPSITALRPDFLATKIIANASASSVMGDDGLLKSIINQIESMGIKVIGPDLFLNNKKTMMGSLGRCCPDEKALSDIQRGFRILVCLGPVDVGQAVVVQDNLVLAIEAIEGTDAMLKRSGGLMQVGPGGVMVKLPKPNQDRRADMPTIGPQTIENAYSAGLRGVAVDGLNTLLIDREMMIDQADKKGLFIFAFDMDEWIKKVE